MPTMQSAKKRLRQNIKQNLRNRSYRAALKTQLKKFLSVIKEGNAQTAQEELRLTVKKLDTGVAKGILPKNTASRKKSRLTKKFNQMKTPA
ncbi:MAG: 30S ribosomal protein S20 [Candidatus Brocadiales bacterium]|uniref:30S ribosomal protein S20 n=1 Tax=Candidatus Wunengus sp. YC60 TaxID=3367697 RepID=UPI002712B6B1|nr:30S ribosomal protein S20 [Candidatus Brocadiales bacterium]